MQIVLAVLVLAIIPHEGVTETRVDAIEVGAVYCDQGRLVFTQFVFLDDWGAYPEVCDWRLAKPGMIAERRAGYWELVWMDGQTLTKVRATSLFFSHHQYDDELLARSRLAIEKRRGVNK